MKVEYPYTVYLKDGTKVIFLNPEGDIEVYPVVPGKQITVVGVVTYD